MHKPCHTFRGADLCAWPQRAYRDRGRLDRTPVEWIPESGRLDLDRPRPAGITASWHFVRLRESRPCRVLRIGRSSRQISLKVAVDSRAFKGGHASVHRRQVRLLRARRANASSPQRSCTAEPKGRLGWLSHRFGLSCRDVEDGLAERGVTVTDETIR